MHTIKLNVGDGIYNHLMFLLKNLNTKELEIIEDLEESSIDFDHISETKMKELKKLSVDYKSGQKSEFEEYTF